MKKLKIFVLVLISALALRAQEPILHLNFNETDFVKTTTELISGKVLTIKNHFDSPERFAGNFGNALRLDGYSTYMKEESIEINYDSFFTIEAWYATEAHSYEFGSIVEQFDNQGGFRLQVDPFGRVRFTFFFNGIQRTLTTNKRIEKYKWNHIVASVNGELGEANIYVNGENWLMHNFASNAVLNSSKSDLWIGKSSLNQLFSGFSLNTLNGVIDDIKIYKVALSKNAVTQHFNTATISDVELSIDPFIRHRNDYLRPRYHSMPNTSWTNECYGLTYYNNQYHLFFQKNPNGPYLYFMHWGHLTSPDLITWKEERIALAPSFGFDDFGTWSGTTTFDTNGKPIIFYTGVDGSKAGIGSAFPLDDSLIKWEENSANPLISNPPLGFPNNDFRDPFIFKKDGLYYMIVGSGLANDGGGILFSYRSKDLKNWELIPPIWKSTDLLNHGHFWEMPTMIPLDNDNYFVQVTPLYLGKPANSIYWIGRFDGVKFTPNFEIAKPLEFIDENLLAPAFGQDEHGAWSYVGILPEDRNVADQIKAGWRHTFSLPRIVRLLDDGNTLGTIPHPNVCRLRTDSTVIENRRINVNEINNFKDFLTQQGEIELLINFDQSEYIEIEVFKSPSTGNKTKIILDKNNGKISLDRTQSSSYKVNEDFRSKGYAFNPNNEVKLRIFLDHSTIEVFVDDLISFSDRVYPDEDGAQVDVHSSDNTFILRKIAGYHFGNKEEQYDDVTCPPIFLPNNLYTSTVEIVKDEHLKISPNPVNDVLHFNAVHPNEILIFDTTGKLVLQAHDADQVSVSHLPGGLYFLYLRIEGRIFTEKIIKM